MLIIVTAVATLFFCFPHLNKVDSEVTDDIVDIDKNGDSQTIDTPSESEKVSFYNFNTALKHAYNYLNKTNGYKTFCYGKFSLNVKNLVNIEQTIKISTEINNKNNSSHATVCTYGDGKIKNNIGFEFVKTNNEVNVRRSKDRVGTDFSYADKEYSTFDMETYKKDWSVLPEHAFTKFSLSKVLNGNMTKNANNYILTFTLERGEIINDSVVFVKRFFGNSDNCQQINPSFTNMIVELTLDQYGRPSKARYSTKFYDLNLYGVGIPLSGLGGNVSYTQQFYGYGQDIEIKI